MIYALFIGFVLAVCAGLGVAAAWQSIGSRRREQARLARIAADTWERHQRQEAQRDWERHCVRAFEIAMGSRPDLAAMRAAREAESLDAEWAAMNGEPS